MNDKKNKNISIIIMLIIVLIVILVVYFLINLIYKKTVKIDNNSMNNIVVTDSKKNYSENEIIEECVNISEEKYYFNIKSIDKNNKTLWTYKTEEGSNDKGISIFIIGIINDTIYIAENKNITVLNMSDGSIKWKNEYKYCEKPYTIFDEDSNLYLIGAYSNMLYKIDKFGNVVNKIEIKEGLDSEKALIFNYDNTKLFIFMLNTNDEFISVDLNDFKYEVIDNGKYKDLISILNLCCSDINIENSYNALSAYALKNSEKYYKETINEESCIIIPINDAKDFMKKYFGKENFNFNNWSNLEYFEIDKNNIKILNPVMDWTTTEQVIVEIVENKDKSITLYTEIIEGLGLDIYHIGKAKIDLEINENEFYLKSFKRIGEKEERDLRYYQ